MFDRRRISKKNNIRSVSEIVVNRQSGQDLRAEDLHATIVQVIGQSADQGGYEQFLWIYEICNVPFRGFNFRTDSVFCIPVRNLRWQVFDLLSREYDLRTGHGNIQGKDRHGI